MALKSQYNLSRPFPVRMCLCLYANAFSFASICSSFYEQQQQYFSPS